MERLLGMFKTREIQFLKFVIKFKPQEVLNLYLSNIINDVSEKFLLRKIRRSFQTILNLAGYFFEILSAIKCTMNALYVLYK